MKYGGKIVLGLGVLGTCVLTIVTPFAARANIYWLIVVRVLEGFGEVSCVFKILNIVKVYCVSSPGVESKDSNVT